MTVRVRKTETALKAKKKAKVAPWMVIRHPGGEPVYATTFKEARAVIERDIARFERVAKELRADDMQQAVTKLQDAVSSLTPMQTGSQQIEGYLPSPAGGKVKYQAELRLRESF